VRVDTAGRRTLLFAARHPVRRTTSTSEKALVTRIVHASVVLALLALGLVPGETRPAQAADGQMVWAVHVTVASRWLDPGETESAITPFMVLYAINDALVKPMPDHAEPGRVVDDVAHGTTYEFLLRGNAKFHDGSPVTAPVWENALIRAFGPRVEEGALALIPSYPYSAPYEELRLKSR
jgi:ABC-type transport system substrate-binding protein